MTPEAGQNAMLERLARKYHLTRGELWSLYGEPSAKQAELRDADQEVLAFGRELLQAVQERERWISVEERLPEMRPMYTDGPLESERVLVTDGKRVDISRYGETYKKRICRWKNSWLDWTHWRPLPKPPGEEQSYADLFMEEK